MGESNKMIELKKIKEFRDFKHPMDELAKTVNLHSFAPHEYENSVIVCKEHVINVLDKYKGDEISELDVARWAKFIMFSEWYDYCQENYESIASIVAELEAPLSWHNFSDEDDGELNEFIGKLSTEKADIYIQTLKNNLEI